MSIFGFLFSILLGALLNRLVNFFFTTMIITFVLTFILCAIYFWNDWKKSLKKTEEGKHIRILLTLLIPICSFSFMSFVPINIDRSFTVMTLSTVYNQNGYVLNLNDLELKISSFFDPKSNEIRRRVKEQVLLGNLALEGNTVYLTKRGRIQVYLNERLAYFFDLNLKYVKGLQ